MPMPSALYDVLKEKLADTVYKVDGEDKPVLEILEFWKDQEEYAKTVKSNNDDLTKQRDEWEATKKQLRQDYESLQGEVKRLQTGNLTDEDRKKFEEFKKSGMTDEMKMTYDSKVNTLTEQIETLTSQVGELTNGIQAEKQAAKQALKDKALSDASNSVIGALAKVGITKSAPIAKSLIFSEGMLNISEADDGFTQKYCIKKDGKVFEANSVDEVAQHVASTYENLVDSSGNAGTGSQHGSNSGSGTTYDGMPISQLQDKFHDMMA